MFERIGTLYRELDMHGFIVVTQDNPVVIIPSLFLPNTLHTSNRYFIRKKNYFFDRKAMARARVHIKGDERILGDSEFVEQVLKAAEDHLERRYALEAKGYDFDRVVDRVAEVLNIEYREVLSRSKDSQTVKARRLLCYWANRELGMATVEIAHRLKISQSAVSRASRCGEKIASENEFQLIKSS